MFIYNLIDHSPSFFGATIGELFWSQTVPNFSQVIFTLSYVSRGVVMGASHEYTTTCFCLYLFGHSKMSTRGFYFYVIQKFDIFFSFQH